MVNKSLFLIAPTCNRCLILIYRSCKRKKSKTFRSIRILKLKIDTNCNRIINNN